MTYCLQRIKDIQIVGLKREVVGLDSGKYVGISSIFNFRCDPYLWIEKAACRRIPCAYLTCLEMIKTSWDIYLDNKEYSRYRINEWCIYWRNFKRYNNWRVVDLVTTNVTSGEGKNIYELILHGIEARKNKRIFMGSFGTMISNDEAT